MLETLVSFSGILKDETLNPPSCHFIIFSFYYFVSEHVVIALYLFFSFALISHIIIYYFMYYCPSNKINKLLVDSRLADFHQFFNSTSFGLSKYPIDNIISWQAIWPSEKFREYYVSSAKGWVLQC